MKQFPIHDDDIGQLMHIRRYLIGYRKTNGWTQPQLSQMINHTEGMVWELESSQTWQWRFSRLQSWPVPFGMRLDAVLCFPDDPDLGTRVHEHPEVAPLFALSQGRSAWQRWQRMYLTSALRVARKELEISTQTLGRFMGSTAKGVWNWEGGGDEVMLGKVLHYARLLDGFVELKISHEAAQLE